MNTISTKKELLAMIGDRQYFEADIGEDNIRFLSRGLGDYRCSQNIVSWKIHIFKGEVSLCGKLLNKRTDIFGCVLSEVSCNKCKRAAIRIALSNKKG